MDLVPFRAYDHHALPQSILIRNVIHVEGPLFCIFGVVFGLDCRRSTFFHLNLLRCLSTTYHTIYFGCIRVGKLCNKFDEGLSLDCYMGPIIHIELPQLDWPLKQPSKSFGLLENLTQWVVSQDFDRV